MSRVQPDRQHLPVPIAGGVPAHAALAGRRIRLSATVAIYAAAAAVVLYAAWLAIVPATPSMFLSADGLHVDGVAVPRESTADGVTVFTGSVTLALTSAHGDEIAAAETIFQGRRTTGRCVRRGLREQCRFFIGATVLTALDTFDSRESVWQRVYSDGTAVSIAVPQGAGLVPVALPLGWG